MAIFDMDKYSPQANEGEHVFKLHNFGYRGQQSVIEEKLGIEVACATTLFLNGLSNNIPSLDQIRNASMSNL